MSTPNPNNSNHPFNLEFLTRTMLAQIEPQPGHNRPRSEWNDDDRFNGRPTTSTIQVLFVKPNEAPELVTLENDLEPMQKLIGGTITTFDSGIDGTIGVANDEAVLLQMPPNRYISSTGSLIFGPFFIASSGINFHSLNEQELESALRAFVPPLTLEQLQKALRASDASNDDRIEHELDDALDD